MPRSKKSSSRSRSRPRLLPPEPSPGEAAMTTTNKDGGSQAEVASLDSGLASASSSTSSGTTTPADDVGMCGLSELVTSCLSSAAGGGTAASRQSAANRDAQPFLSASLFTGIPPTVRFYTKGTKVSRPNRKITSRLTWCHNSLLPIVMRHSLAASHFTIIEESGSWVGYWGRHLKSQQYRNLKAYQKVNHFPGAFHVGRKDRLWMHIDRMKEKFGDEYNIMPHTYILPRDKEDLVDYLAADGNHFVIVKPPASARGTGISVTRKIKEIAVQTQLIAQHYVDRPLTINGAKFDLRFYAYVPCLEPLRVYMFQEGLVRFASVPYSYCGSTVSNKYMHLTNYSINKLAEADGVADSPVPKWRLTELWEYFENEGIDSESIRERIEMLTVKAFIACEKSIRDHMARHISYGFICHELFGIDILLDEKLRPWLLEVNISPSLHSGTPLDVSVKAPLAKDVLNMAGIHVPPSAEDASGCIFDISTKPRYWPKATEHVVKENTYVDAYLDEGKLNPKILRRLTAEDTKMLIDFEDEYARRGNFKLVYPTAETQPLLKYFDEPVYANLLLQQWQLEQGEDREPGIRRLDTLCRQGRQAWKSDKTLHM